MDRKPVDGRRLGTLHALPPQLRRHAYEHVYRVLRRALVTGQIPEGTRLVETELAERLGVSRTPVRDALRRLESEGFAERGYGVGLWSRPMSPAAIRDLFLVRAELDNLAARLACERAEPEQWQAPEALLGGMAEAVRVHGPGSDAFSEAHLAFHTAVYRIAFGPRFAGFLDHHLLQYLQVAADLSYRQPALTTPAVEQHQRLLAELSSGDTARAVAAMQAHVRRSAADARAALDDPADPGAPEH